MDALAVDDAVGAAATRAAITVAPVDTVSGVLSLEPPETRHPTVFSLWHAMTVGTSVPSEAQPKKRRLAPSGRELTDHDEDDGEDRTSSESDERNARNKKQKKKPTYIARKEEKALLEREVRDLEARAEQLRKTAGITGLSAVATQLRDAVDKQNLVVATSQSVLSELMANQQRSPLECAIHLTRDWRQRQATLLALRGPKMDLARRFLAARMRFVNPTKLCSETSKFQQDDGALCTIKLTVAPFRGLRSAKQVYDALLFYFFNIEISISEITGRTTVNEHHDDSSAGKQSDADKTVDRSSSAAVLCHRLVTDLHDGLVVEKNSIQFLSAGDTVTSDDGLAGDEFALMTSDFANSDELYPYVPDARVRKDINTVIRISSHRERSAGADGADTDGELVVVLTYWAYIKTHASTLTHRHVTAMQLERVHDELVHTMDALPVSIRQTLYGAD